MTNKLKSLIESVIVQADRDGLPLLGALVDGPIGITWIFGTTEYHGQTASVYSALQACADNDVELEQRPFPMAESLFGKPS